MAQALAIYLEADRILFTCVLDDDAREYYEGVKASAMSAIFFG